DGESPWIHRDPALAERPLHMAMGAYGPKTGAPRILNVLDRYGIKAGWYIPGWIIERYPELCREIVRRGHEVGQHGHLHDWPFFGFSAVPPVGNGIWSQEDVFEVWKEEFEGAWEEGGFFNLMGHPQVVGRPSRMRMVSRLLELILGKGDVWIARPIEIAEHYLSQR